MVRQKMLSSPDSVVNFERGQIGDEAMAVIRTMLTDKRTAPHTLILRWCSLTGAGAVHLAECLKLRSSSLTSVDLSWNAIGERGLRDVCEALKAPNKTLKTLDLTKNDLGVLFIATV